MRAILVSVNYHDLLSITLPYNRNHFDEVMVVSSFEDRNTADVAMANRCHLHRTEAFTANGATFNKWAALEEGLNVFGRHGWLCIMDADVLWPKHPCWVPVNPLEIGKLYTPLRRMWDNWPRPFVYTNGILDPDTPGYRIWFEDGETKHGPSKVKGVPGEGDWCMFPIHRNVAEWAGYSQIFHADDPHLGPVPWHEVDWKHAGGADSFFQAKWPAECKVRPPFEVLHLGPAGQNWFGRATPLADGTVLPGSEERRDLSGRKIWHDRRTNRAEGRDQFDGEKIK